MIYIHLGILCYAVFYADQGMFAVLAIMSTILASAFYWLTFELLAGLRVSRLNTNYNIMDSMTNRMVHIVTTILLLKSGEPILMGVAIYTIPWLAVCILADTLSILLKHGILEIQPKK